MRICGPKLSICCSIISVWGILMLVLMGVFLYVHSATFAEDLKIDEDAKDFNTQVDQHFTRTAYNCWIAALLYVVSFALSVHQYFANRRVQHSL